MTCVFELVRPGRRPGCGLATRAGFVFVNTGRTFRSLYTLSKVIDPWSTLVNKYPVYDLTATKFALKIDEVRVPRCHHHRSHRIPGANTFILSRPMRPLRHVLLILATPINALRAHPFAVPSCAPQSARSASVVMRWDPTKDPIEDPVPIEVRDGRVPEYKPPAPEYQPPEDGCEIVCCHPLRYLRFRAPLHCCCDR